MENALIIRIASQSDIITIHQLAEEIWWPTYQDILSEEQIRFMLDDMYSLPALQKQVGEGAIFIIAEDESQAIGFGSFSFIGKRCKIHKLYISPLQQGKGLGKRLLNFIKGEALTAGCNELELNVNRNNKALQFYLKEGFSILKEVDIPYFDFVLNDYVMRLKLKRKSVDVN